MSQNSADPNSTDISPAGEIRRTPLHALHLALGARMVPFAGYDMPVQYRDGIIAEHNWTRENAGLFDVSHMGQALLEGPDAARALETLCAADIAGLAEKRTRYTQFLNEDGGILDDLMVTRRSPQTPGEDCLLLIVNAARKEADFALLRERLPHLRLTILEDRALLALQGPKAVEVLSEGWPGIGEMPFMSFATLSPAMAAEKEPYVWRSGYTGEDGFEISVHTAFAVKFAERLLANPLVRPIGLGARDSLRLEAGLCLYGHDIDESTSPVEADLVWSTGKRRRAEGDFPGAARIQRELQNGPSRKRIGLTLDGRQPAREGAEIATRAGEIIGRVTSGGFSPTLQKPIAMGYVAANHAAIGADLDIIVRGKALGARVTQMPFIPHRYKR